MLEENVDQSQRAPGSPPPLVWFQGLYTKTSSGQRFQGLGFGVCVALERMVAVSSPDNDALRQQAEACVAS